MLSNANCPRCALSRVNYDVSEQFSVDFVIAHHIGDANWWRPRDGGGGRMSFGERPENVTWKICTVF